MKKNFDIVGIIQALGISLIFILWHTPLYRTVASELSKKAIAIGNHVIQKP